MRILMVIPYMPNRIRVRSYEFLRALRGAGHELTLATLWTSAAEEADLARIERMGVSVLAHAMPAWRSALNSLLAGPTKTPLQAVYSWHPALLAAMVAANAAQPFDVVHVEHLRGSRYGLALLQEWRGLTGRPPVVWDSVDCISYLFEQAAKRSRSAKSRLMTRIELPRTRHYEAQLLRCFDHTVVTSVLDKEALAALGNEWAQTTGGSGKQETGAAIDVVPNGVDLQTFRVGEAGERHSNRIVFSGKMSYHANATAAVHLVNDIMPSVWKERPDVEVWLVGKDPAPSVRALGEAAPAGGPGRVVVTGEVAEMQEYIRGAAVAVAPLLYGAGIQNKVLEAMACATPVVASPQASQSLAAVAGRDYFEAGTPAEFAESILALLQSAERRQEVGCAGRRFVEAHHSWESAAVRLTEIYREARSRISHPEFSRTPPSRSAL